MKDLSTTKDKLIGEWSVVGGKLVPNEACFRIDYLINHALQRIGTDESGWDILYRDPKDGRLWELTYPQSHMHGGGPPKLTLMSASQANEKYGDIPK